MFYRPDAESGERSFPGHPFEVDSEPHKGSWPGFAGRTLFLGLLGIDYGHEVLKTEQIQGERSAGRDPRLLRARGAAHSRARRQAVVLRDGARPAHQDCAHAGEGHGAERPPPGSRALRGSRRPGALSCLRWPDQLPLRAPARHEDRATSQVGGSPGKVAVSFWGPRPWLADGTSWSALTEPLPP